MTAHFCVYMPTAISLPNNWVFAITKEKEFQKIIMLLCNGLKSLQIKDTLLRCVIWQNSIITAEESQKILRWWILGLKKLENKMTLTHNSH